MVILYLESITTHNGEAWHAADLLVQCLDQGITSYWAR